MIVVDSYRYLGIPYTTSQQTFATIRGSLAKELGEVVTVPTISKGDMRITDSWKIAEYVGQPSYFSTAWVEALTRRT